MGSSLPSADEVFVIFCYLSTPSRSTRLHVYLRFRGSWWPRWQLPSPLEPEAQFHTLSFTLFVNDMRSVLNLDRAVRFSDLTQRLTSLIISGTTTNKADLA